MATILLASTSPLKLAAVRRAFPKHAITTINCDTLGLPPQPINCAEICALLRLRYSKNLKFPQTFDFYISIENGINKEDKTDICHVLIEHKGLFAHQLEGITIPVPPADLDCLSIETYSISGYNILGSPITVGEIIQRRDPSVDPKDWMSSPKICPTGKSRADQIEASLHSAKSQLDGLLSEAKSLIKGYKVYQDYPKRGVVFEDFFSIIRSGENVRALMKMFVSQFQHSRIDYIVGPESRGFFGFGISCMMNVGFIPLRKKGKLPGPVISITYETEYSTDTLEMPADIEAGCRVIVFDDLIASGGSLRAARVLLEGAGCIIVDYVVLREVVSLREQAQKKLGCPYRVLLQD